MLTIQTLNTISNLGGQWPRLIVLFAVDYFTKAHCSLDSEKATPEQVATFASFSCSKEADKQNCISIGGSCDVDQDGYHISNLLCVAIGATLFFTWIKPKVQYLQTLDISKWRIEK